MTPGWRKFVLTAHITFSVGWLGAVAGFLALTIAGLAGQDMQIVRAAYLMAEPIIWFAVLPLALASLLTGIVQSLGTPWGLIRHYWVLFKLLLTVLAIVVLLPYTQTVSHFADLASGMDRPYRGGLQSYLLHAGGGFLVLLVTTILSVYKPKGRTPYGQRK
jgi:hypothetical protein